MAMFLSGVTEIVIQRVGRWESFAFMEYIREQVETFAYGVAEKMLECENFYHIQASGGYEDKKIEQKSKKNENHTVDKNGDSIRIPFSVQFHKGLFQEKKRQEFGGY